jgi:hypothetical protein
MPNGSLMAKSELESVTNEVCFSRSYGAESHRHNGILAQKKWSGRISDDGATKFILIGPTSNISFQTVVREYKRVKVQRILRGGYLFLTEPISSRQGAF